MSEYAGILIPLFSQEVISKRCELGQEHRVEPFFNREEDPRDVHNPEPADEKMDEFREIGRTRMDEHGIDRVKKDHGFFLFELF
jgi:hypothetical protein